MREQHKSLDDAKHLQQVAPGFYKKMVRAKCKALLLLDNCKAHHTNAYLGTIEMLFLPRYTTAMLLLMNQGVIANFEAHHQRRLIECLLLDVCTADSAANLKVPLVNAILFASRVWRNMKPQIILKYFKNADFPWSITADAMPAGDGETAVDVAATTDGADVAIRMERLWEFSIRLGLVSSGLNCMDLIFASTELIATKDLSTDELAKNV